MLIEHWGPIPDEAWAKARRAYGHSVDAGYSKAVSLVSDQAYLSSCLQKMGMQPVLAGRILALLQGFQSSEG